MLTVADLRRHVLQTQGYASRFRRASDAGAADAIQRLACVQLDSIATVDRSHRLVLGSRVGAMADGAETRLLSSGRVFEYWAHEASLVPTDDWPLFTHRMRERHVHHWFGPVIDQEPKLAESILERIRSEGALPSRAFEGKGGGGMWNWKPAKRMLDALWTAGKLVISARNGFERVYELPERVIPASVLDAEPPAEADAIAALALRAVEARGALTLAGIAEHYRLGAQRDLRPVVQRLVDEGQLVVEGLDDGGADVFLPRNVAVESAPTQRASVLLSPFDNLLWDRAFARRLFGFDHRMEIYKPPSERVYGYYVMPFLHGERFVGRADVKADRAAGKLLVHSFHLEPGIEKTDALEEAAFSALSRLARGLKIEAPERVRWKAPPRARGAGAKKGGPHEP